MGCNRGQPAREGIDEEAVGSGQRISADSRTSLVYKASVLVAQLSLNEG